MFIPFLAICLASFTGVMNNKNATFSDNSAQKSSLSPTVKSAIDVNDKIVLRVKNMEDYIYITDDNTDIFFQQFEAYADSLGYHNVDVVYSTTDTNETLYSQLATGKSGYDLICPSEYMIQKMIRENLIMPFDKEQWNNDIAQWGYTDENGDPLLESYYTHYASQYIRNRFEAITTTNSQNESVNLGQYGVGYMWGTLGLLFNPSYAKYDVNQTLDDAANWDMLWNTSYNGTISIKDSVRDTYAMAVLQLYKTELQGYRQQYENHEITSNEYNAKISEVFNRCDDDTIQQVEDLLGDLRANIFGLEVDSGKSDIVTGKIGINLAWSGDAVYSMDQGQEEGEELCYSIPLSGSNLWFDAWVMPNCARSELQEDVAYLFLDFLSHPDYAFENMEYTGYTSFIGGTAIQDLVLDWYDVRTGELYYCLDEKNETYVSIYRMNPTDASEYVSLTYDDFLTTSHNSAFDSFNLVYFSEDEDGAIVDPSKYSYVYVLDDNGGETNVKKTYGDLTIVDDPESGIEKVDLNYFFNNDFQSEAYVPNPSYYFYSDSYFTDSTPIEVDDGQGNVTYIDNIAVGRQFFCQYPDFEAITRCAVMKDFGDANQAVLAMWERFKSTSLPVWATVLFIVEIVGGIALVGYFLISKKMKYRLRQKRKENHQAK